MAPMLGIAGRMGAAPQPVAKAPRSLYKAEVRNTRNPVPEPLHLLHVFPSFNVGGAQMRFVALVDGLGAGFRHTVVSLSGNREAAEHIAPGCAVTYAETPPISGGLISRLLHHRRVIADLRPDVLVTYNWGAIEWGMANALTATPHVHIEDGFGPDEARRQLPRRVWARRLALRRSTVVVPSVVLKDIAAKVWRLPVERTHYIPNGIEPRDISAIPVDSLALPPDLPRIVWAGALRREKNLLRLLRAFAPIKTQAVLVVIGDGPERAAMDQEIERLALGPHVRMLGHRTDARDVIMHCDLMALSSDTEQMPLTILEAMDAGLPVASVDVGDVRNMVAPKNQAFVVPAEGEALTAALQTLLADPLLRKRLGRANRERLRSTFARRGMVDAYDALFRRVARRGPGR